MCLISVLLMSIKVYFYNLMRTYYFRLFIIKFLNKLNIFFCIVFFI